MPAHHSLCLSLASPSPPPSQQQSGNLRTARRAEPAGGGGSGRRPVKRVNGMMVVYGFVLQGARLQVWLCNDRGEASRSLWMLSARPPHPAPGGKGIWACRLASPSDWGLLSQSQGHTQRLRLCVSDSGWPRVEVVLRHHACILLSRHGCNYS